MKTSRPFFSFAAGLLSAALLLLASAPLHAQVSSGAGTAGKIPLWTGPHSQGDSIMLQKSGKIGIATTAPTSPLTVAGGTSSVATFATSNTAGTALRATSSTGVGSYTFSDSGTGLYGSSNSGYGIYGFHKGNDGTHAAVFGKDNSTASSSAAILGVANAGSGVSGQSTAGIGVKATSTSSYGVYSTSTSSYGGYFRSTNSDAADFSGHDWGIYVTNAGSHPAVQGIEQGSGSSAYGGKFTSANYRAGYFKSSNNGLFSLYVDTQDGPTQATSGLEVNGGVRVEGNLVVAGSKSGYVVDHMQNVDSAALEPGDVVSVTEESGTPVLGQKIPVPRIRRASSAYDTAVVGVVDEVTYVPSDSVRQAYAAQQENDRQVEREMSSMTPEQKANFVSKADRVDRISDEAGSLHADPHAARAERGGYCAVVTLGAYQAVKVDASYGAIRVGDLLTTSPHAGYAMKVSDKAAASGAVIGKALSSLSTGTGTVSILVTLK